MNLMKNQYKQMELRVDCYRETQAELEDQLRYVIRFLIHVSDVLPAL
jgi:hypothetical protein